MCQSYVSGNLSLILHSPKQIEGISPCLLFEPIPPVAQRLTPTRGCLITLLAQMCRSILPTVGGPAALSLDNSRGRPSSMSHRYLLNRQHRLLLAAILVLCILLSPQPRPMSESNRRGRHLIKNWRTFTVHHARTIIGNCSTTSVRPLTSIRCPDRQGFGKHGSTSLNVCWQKPRD